MSANTTADADMVAGAASHSAMDWSAIDWRQAQQNVRRLQARIVKATQQGRWGKVKALQHLLTRSFSGKALAVRRVTENQGKRTAGVDGVTWPTPQSKATAITALRQRGYQPQPLRRVYIAKRNGGRRPLSIPTLHDRAMRALYLLALDPIAETTADPNSYGFRSCRALADAIEQCFSALAKTISPVWILEGDLRSCFDTISHKWIEAHIPLERAILHKWLKAGYMAKGVLHPTEEGCPQGGICSPVIANMTLDGLEARLEERFPDQTIRGKWYSPKVNLCRFADDFIVTGATKELLENEVKPLVEAFMRERGLELSAEKTSITHIASGFDFLGQNIRKYNGKLLIKPSAKSIKSLLGKVRQVIKANKSSSAGTLICKLNPLIRGWAQYHQHVVSARTFQSVDHVIFKALWSWAKRRHRHKGARWVKPRYFHNMGNRSWVFSGEAHKDGKAPKSVELYYAHRLHIKRHVKIRSKVNPYDPTWEVYLEERSGLKMVASLKGRRSLLYLWRRQNGRCPQCGEKITRISGWHNHHKIWRSHGGSNKMENRVLLHPTCHRQVHHFAGNWSAPHPVTGMLAEA